jgi:hypothetical protein
MHATAYPPHVMGSVRPRNPSEEEIILRVGTIRSASFPTEVKDVVARFENANITYRTSVILARGGPWRPARGFITREN